MIFYQQSIEYFIQTNQNKDYEEKSVNIIFYDKNGQKAFLHGIFLYAYSILLPQYGQYSSPRIGPILKDL